MFAPVRNNFVWAELYWLQILLRTLFSSSWDKNDLYFSFQLVSFMQQIENKTQS